jgi:hypothetical protein
MTTSRSLVPLEVPSWPPARRKRSRILRLLILSFTLTGVVVLGAGMLRSGPAEPRASNEVPVLGVAPIMFAEPWVATPLPIHIARPGVADNGFIQIDGLPMFASLSEGHATRPGSWAVPMARLAALKIVAPPSAEDAPQRLTIALFSHEGIALGEARPLLAVMPAERLAVQPAGQAAVGE